MEKIFTNNATGVLTIRGNIENAAIILPDDPFDPAIDPELTNHGTIDIQEFKSSGILCQACTIDNTGTINIDAPSDIDIFPAQRGLNSSGQSFITNQNCGVFHIKASIVYNSFAFSSFKNHGYIIIDDDYDSVISAFGFSNCGIIADVQASVYDDIIGTPNDFGIIIYPPLSQIYLGDNVTLEVVVGSGNATNSLGGTGKNEVYLDENCTNSAGVLNFASGFHTWTPNADAVCESEFYIQATANVTCSQMIYFRTPTPVYDGLFANLNIKAFLQGPYNGTTMNDDIRTILDTTDPYLGTVTASSTAFDARGTDSVVDWVLVELDRVSNSDIYQFPLLIQRDGDIVDRDGISIPDFNIARCEDYNVIVKHRNHLGMMTATPVFVE